MACLPPGHAKTQGRASHRRIAGKIFGGGPAGRLEGGLGNEGFVRMAGELELREHDEIGPLGGRLRPSLPDNGRIARNIP